MVLTIQQEKQIASRLGRWRLQSVARDLLPGESVCKCCRQRFAGYVSVKLSSANVCHYGGLETCSSVWVCPICAAKISERRREEVEQAVIIAISKGWFVVLLTLTVPHSIDQSLREVLEGYQGSRRLMRGRTSWKTLSKSIGLQGSIRALEATFGLNGWHLHSHEVLFLSVDCDRAALAERILSLWQSACQKGYGRVPNGHGVNVQGADDPDKYLADMTPSIEFSEAGLSSSAVDSWQTSRVARVRGKELLEPGSGQKRWGIAHEVTKTHVKRSRDDASDTPWDLLRRAADGAEWAGALFIEWGRTMKRKHQLEWSRGLWARLGLDGEEKSDEEIAKEDDPDSLLLGLITPAQWNRICSQEMRGEILQAAQLSGWPGVVGLIKALGV